MVLGAVLARDTAYAVAFVLISSQPPWRLLSALLRIGPSPCCSASLDRLGPHHACRHRRPGLGWRADFPPWPLDGEPRQARLLPHATVEQERFVWWRHDWRWQPSKLTSMSRSSDRAPCSPSSGDSVPAQREPLSWNFDFERICSRYLDANGYSAHRGETIFRPGWYESEQVVGASGDDKRCC